MTLKITFLLMALLILTQCQKKEPEEKPGFYAFSCTVNGNEWIAKTPGTISSAQSLYVSYIPQTGDLSVTATRKDGDNTYFESINFYCPNVTGPGDYSLYTGDGEFMAFGDYLDNYTCGIYYHDMNNPGSLHISTLDTIQDRITGNFYFTAINQDCNDSLLTVADGHFNIRY